MVELITGYGDKIYILLSVKGDPNFVVRIKKEMNQNYARMVHSEKMMGYKDYMITLLSSAMLGVITYWYETGKRISSQELSDIIYCFAKEGVLNIFPKES